MKRSKGILVILYLFFVSVCNVGFLGVCNAESTIPTVIKKLTKADGLPCNEVRYVYQDKEGFIWIATNDGLVRYDGKEYHSYKSNLYTRNILSSNVVHVVTEDHSHCLWIGTASGLNVLNKQTGMVRQIDPHNLRNNFIQSLITASNGDVWIGTKRGVHRYVAALDSIVVYSGDNALPQLSGNDIKTLYEDSNHQIWIGTWAAGLFRYDMKEDRFYQYPRFNSQNSAHVVYEDSRHNIWVGTWDYGLFRLENPYEMDKVGFVQYAHRKDDDNSLVDNIVYAISEDVKTHSLWVGSRSGVSILDIETGVFQNLLPDKESSISYNEVNTIFRDRDDMMWLGMMGGGVNLMDTHKRQFVNYDLSKVQTVCPTSSVRSLLLDDDNVLWIGMGSYGLSCYNRAEDRYLFYNQIPDLKDVPSVTINAIIERSCNKEIWFGTYDAGIIIYKKDAPAKERIRYLNWQTASWLGNYRVYAFYEDSKKNIWIGTLNGFAVVTPAGDTYSYPFTDESSEKNAVLSFVEDVNGDMWIGTNCSGIVRFRGDYTHPDGVDMVYYSTENGNSEAENVRILCIDKRGQLWVGTEGEGLCIYNRDANVFYSVHADYKLPGDAVYSIEEDKSGNLWLGSNDGLLCLDKERSLDTVTYHLYTMADGLEDNVFARNAVFQSKKGELFFGGHNGLNSFFPEKLSCAQHSPVAVITDIRVFNKSWSTIEEQERREISQSAPVFANKITLRYDQNNFSVDFAVLSYTNPNQHKYAYRLDTYDKNWIYSDASRNFAYYNNMESGIYHFRLRGANGNGEWSPLERELEIEVLPAPWMTWWAYLIYILLALGAAYTIFYMIHKRMLIETAAKMAEDRRQKSDEMNHAKLQFFTNITHELMTPLTIIRASLDEYHSILPKESNFYNTVYNNTTRLMRLLQQILEFRKAESGNLQLRVSQGNLTKFVQSNVEGFRPLIRRKNMDLTLSMPNEEIYGYFDPDKLDKILYNLLSNAVKYNKEQSSVKVLLAFDKESNSVTLSVSDNGEGISPEAMKNLFKRFYEGNYRRFNTVGTGIGLSLVKDLVDLHKGTISVDSVQGRGASFIVKIPLSKDVYEESQIDESVEINDIPVEEKLVDEVPISVPLDGDGERYNLLIVEDNDDLRNLLINLLGHYYNVYSAENGVMGLKMAEDNRIDLVISDIMMPEMDGMELCKTLKTQFEFCHIPVILLTAKQGEEDQIAGYDSGADGYVRKPFSLALLLAKIKSLIANRERSAKDFKKQMVLKTQELHYTSMDEKFMQKAVDCVYRHLDDISFDQAAFVEEMGTSKSTLYAKLKSLAGMNTSAFIRHIRLKAAMDILQNKKRIRISELAYVVGFNDAKYFSACFKKEFGMLPTEYIERNLGEENEL